MDSLFKTINIKYAAQAKAIEKYRVKFITVWSKIK